MKGGNQQGRALLCGPYLCSPRPPLPARPITLSYRNAPLQPPSNPLQPPSNSLQPPSNP